MDYKPPIMGEKGIWYSLISHTDLVREGGKKHFSKLTFKNLTMLSECPVRDCRKKQRRLQITTLKAGKRSQQPAFRVCDKLRHGKEKNGGAFSQKRTHILRKGK